METTAETMSNVLGNIFSAAQAYNAPTDNDYTGEDGLLYCGVCKEPKQTWVKLPDIEIGTFKDRAMPCICQCRRLEMAAEEKAKQERDMEERRRRLIDFAEVREWTFAKDDRNNEMLSTAARNYVDEWEQMRRDNVGLLLCGNVGAGKSFIAACIANALIDNGIWTKFTSISRIVNDSKYFDMDVSAYISSFPLLILDDFAAERDTEYMFEQVYSIINARYLSGKPMIITSNLTLKEIKNPKNVIHQRLCDRILERCHPIEITTQSRRRQTAANRYHAINDILGIKKEPAI